MSKDPTTTSQVQAYRFVLRRMESALVRKDAVMLHEPMRNHLRATAVGVILSVLGLAAFFVVGKFSPASQVSGGEIVIGYPSETVFVVQDNPRRLIRMLNLTSARLLLVAITRGREAPDTKRVADSALAGIPREPFTGLPYAPPLPVRDNLIQGVWSVCDTVRTDLPNAASNPQRSTTVLIREQPLPGRPLGDDEALLVAEQSTGVTYLVWRGRRRLVDPHDSVVWTYYQLDNARPYKVSAGLFNAIPEGPALKLPAIPSKGEPFPAPEESQLDFTGLPIPRPRVLPIRETSIPCVTPQGPNQDLVITVHPDERSLLKDGESPFPVPRTASGPLADRVFLAPTKGALVRGVEPGKRPETGVIWLVTDQGVRYGVPTMDVARALGLGDVISLAPESILRLLPIGTALDPRLALERYNSEPARQQAEQRTGG